MQNAGGTKQRPGGGNPVQITPPSTAERDAANLRYILELQQRLNKMAQSLQQQQSATLKNQTKKQ
jgi:hypothetical protein